MSVNENRDSWRYVETPLAAEIQAGNIVLRPHWKGAIGSDEIRDVVRRAAAAPALYEALRPFASHRTYHFEQGHTGVASDCPECGPVLRAINALALADKGPASKQTK